MNEHLPFNTPEEKALVFSQAKRGDHVAVDFLQRVYSLYVWTQEEVDAVNLLIENGVRNAITIPLIKLREESEKWDRMKKKEDAKRRLLLARLRRSLSGQRG